MDQEKVLTPNENQFNFRNIGKAIAKFKWWIIGVTVVGTVAGYLAFRFGINPGREKLVSTFGYNINAKVKVEESTSLKNEELANQTLYLSDSSIFSFTDVVSEPRLQAVKDSDEKYKNINVTAMAKNGGIKITRASYTDQVTGKVIYEYPARYTITAGKSNFASEEQGKEFIADLINYELTVAQTANDNYEITDYIGATTGSYGQYVKKLEDQYQAIDENYKDLIKEFDNSSIATPTGESLNVVYNAFQNKYAYGATTIIQQYEGDLYHNHLVDYENVTVESLQSQAESYKANVRSILINLKAYQDSLDSLIATNITNYDTTNSQIEKEILKYNEKILELQKLNGQYVKELINLGYTVPADLSLANVDSIAYNSTGEGVIQSKIAGTAEWKALCDEFKVNLDKAASSLKEDRKVASDHYGFVNNRYRNQVVMFTAGTAELTGHVSSFIGAAAGLVAGFILSTLVCTLLYIARKEKYESKK